MEKTVNWLNKVLVALVFIVAPFGGMSQSGNEVEMATAFYESGKIYVVVTVLVTIFIGIAAYLFALDRKLGNIEKELEKDAQS